MLLIFSAMLLINKFVRFYRVGIKYDIVVCNKSVSCIGPDDAVFFIRVEYFYLFKMLITPYK